MTKKGIVLLVGGVILGYEIIRECLVLKALGFEPARFAEWVRR